MRHFNNLLLNFTKTEGTTSIGISAVVTLLVLLNFGSLQAQTDGTAANAMTPQPMGSGTSSQQTTCCDYNHIARDAYDLTPVSILYDERGYYILSNIDIGGTTYGAFAHYLESGELDWRYRMEAPSRFADVERMKDGHFLLAGQYTGSEAQELVVEISDLGAVVNSRIVGGSSARMDTQITVDKESSDWQYGLLYEGRNDGTNIIRSFGDGFASNFNQGYLPPSGFSEPGCTPTVNLTTIISSAYPNTAYVTAGDACTSSSFSSVSLINDDGQATSTLLTQPGDRLEKMVRVKSTSIVSTGTYTPPGTDVAQASINLFYPLSEEKYVRYTFEDRVSGSFHDIVTPLSRQNNQDVYVAMTNDRGYPAIIRGVYDRVITQQPDEQPTFPGPERAPDDPNGGGSSTPQVDYVLDFSGGEWELNGIPGTYTDVMLGMSEDNEHLVFAYGFKPANSTQPQEIRFGRLQVSTLYPYCGDRRDFIDYSGTTKPFRRVAPLGQTTGTTSLTSGGTPSLVDATIPTSSLCVADIINPCGNGYPVATTGYFRLPVSYTQCDKNATTAVIRNALGRELSGVPVTADKDFITIDIRDAPGGVYYIDLLDADGVEVYATSVTTSL